MSKSTRSAPRPGLLARAAHGLGNAFVDTTPIRISRNYRYLYFGQVINLIGTQMRVVALPYQVFLITHSSLMVGLLSLSQVVPLLVFALVGGSVADVVDRRKLLLVTQVLLAACSTLLAIATFRGHPALWYIFAVAIVSSGISAFDQPARRAAIPRLVPRDQLVNALALNQVLNRMGNVVGPSVGGVVLAKLGIAPAYVVDAVTYGAAIIALVLMDPMPALIEGAAAGARGLAAIVEALSYLKDKPVLLSAFVIDLNATILGVPRALFPALATEVFKNGAAGYGMLIAAPSAGALIGALFTGWIGRVRYQGLAVVISVVSWGIALTLFGLDTRIFWLALVLLAIAGASDMVSAVFRGTILQLAVPDNLRGRLAAVQFMVVSSGPRLGDLEAGAVAALTNVEFSIVSGGLGSMIGAIIIAFAIPSFRRYDAIDAPEKLGRLR